MEAEISLIVTAARRNAGNASLASHDFGGSRDTLLYRMEKFGLRRETYQ